MIVVISNRNVNEAANDDNVFGEQPNAKGLDEIRVATATYTAEQKWFVDLLPEPDNLDVNNIPSRQLFEQILTDIKTGVRRSNWVFYIHGFNQSFRSSLDACQEISQTYGVDVINFSWPSNPGGFVTDEYKQARQAAKASSNALDRTLEKLGNYLTNRTFEEISSCTISLNLLIHSLGNYLVENFVREPIFSDQIGIFDNIIFHQADVDNRGHREWIDKIEYGKRLYATINENDSVLKASNAINRARLGNTASLLNSQRMIYLDFTDAKNVDNNHGLFRGVPNNESLNQFFQMVFTGRRGETAPGFIYNQRTNTFRIEENENKN